MLILGDNMLSSRLAPKFCCRCATCNFTEREGLEITNRFVGPSVVTQRIGETEYRLDLSSRAALHGVHNVFRVLLFCALHNNGVHADVPPIEIG